MQLKIQYVALFACAMLVLPATAFADQGTHTKTGNTQYMQAELAQLTCQTNYTTGYLQDIIGINQTEFASLTQDVTRLNGDLTILQGFVSSNNQTDFKSFVKDQLRPDIKTSTLDIKNQVKTIHLTKDQRIVLKSEMLQLRANQKTCLFSAKQQFANAKVQRSQNEIAHVQKRSDVLAGKGLNITALNNVISNASIDVSSLQSAINSANDSKSLQKAINSFCLYNGCKNGTNFHFAANSAIAVKQAQLTKIQSRNGSSTYSTQIIQAQNDLGAAQSVLNTVGIGQYSGTQQSDVWNNIKAATDIIKQIWQELGHK